MFQWQIMPFILAASLSTFALYYEFEDDYSYEDAFIQSAELITTLMVHRHGDRTPLEGEMFLAVDNVTLYPLIQPYGYGQLTKAGMRSGYGVGQFIRRRYNSLLSLQYNGSEIYIRSTDVTRCKMTVLAAMAAVYPALSDNWSENINWNPVPYTTLPTNYDFMEYTISCPNVERCINQLNTSPSARLDKYSELLNELSDITGQEFVKPDVVYQIYDILVSELSLGVDINERLRALMPKLKQAADEAWDIINGDENCIVLQAGVLLNEFFTAADNAIKGVDSPRLRVYSAHDNNVYALAAISQITPRQGVPKYGSAFALELKRLLSGKFVVLAVYLPSPGEPEIYLPVKDCDDILCDYEQFRRITSKYVLNEKEWRNQCGLQSNTLSETV